MNRFVERDLQQRWAKVPVETVQIFDWHSLQGREFLAAVAAAEAAGTDINEIGAVIGMRNFSHRWRILSRRVKT